MKFKLRHMEIFRAVMVSGSINGAARMLHTSQPSLSKTISYLESSLGLRLFNRTRSSLIPTKEAHILFSEISTLFDFAGDIDNLVEDLKRSQKGSLSFGSTPSFALTLIPNAICRFKKTLPDTHIVFRTVTVPEIAQYILGKKAEFIISALPVNHPNLRCEQLSMSNVVCLMPKGHELEQCRAVDLAKISEYPVILYDRSTLFGKLIRAALNEVGTELQSTIDVIRTEQACALVQAGLGLTFVSEYSASEGIWGNCTVRPLVQTVQLPITLIYSSFDSLSEPAMEFIEQLKRLLDGRTLT